MDPSRYQSPLQERYASREMAHLFSPQFKYSTWRRLWTALAEEERALGLPIQEAQIEEMRASIEAIDFEKAARYEEELQHDVMAHIRTYGEQCPRAKGIIHLGATSCFVTDNTDLIQMREGLFLLESKLREAASHLALFAEKTASLPCLGFTHFQPAQLTTVGKRACLWLQDLLTDLEEFRHRLEGLKFLGVKGATGTQASFLTLFSGDRDKVRRLDEAVARSMGFEKLFPLSGQTYSRKQDLLILYTLSSFAASAHKLATDLRLLSHLREIEEPFGSKQVGSTAMPYKRNPILSERICSLSRFLISLSENGAYTASTQWLERSLDDSANRRIVLPEAFLTCDGILNLLIRLLPNLEVNEAAIRHRVQKELPFLATEAILMEGVKRGGDRQGLHEALRSYSRRAALSLRGGGEENPLLEEIERDPSFGLSGKELQALMLEEQFIGRAPDQVEGFLAEARERLSGGGSRPLPERCPVQLDHIF